MKTRLQKVAAKHELDETVYVCLEERPNDSDWLYFAANCDKQALLADDSEMVVGVYQLVGVERVKRTEALITKKLA